MLAYAAVGTTIAFTVISQLLQKHVAYRRASISNTHRLAVTSGFKWYLQQSSFWLALICLGIGMLFWLYALTLLDVSKAYSLLSANYLLVPLLAQRWFRERLSMRQWLGVGILLAGLMIVSHS